MKNYQAVAALHIDVVAHDAEEGETIARGIAEMILQETDVFAHVDFATIRVGSPIGNDKHEFDAALVARYRLDADDEASAIASAAEIIAREVLTNSAWISAGGVAYVEEKTP